MPTRKHPGVYPYETRAGRMWGVVYDAVKGGKRVQKRRHGFRTKAEAVAFQTDALARRNAGDRVIEPDTTPFAVYLAQWVDDQIDAAPRSRMAYRARFAHIPDAVGRVPLARISPAVLDQMYRQWQRDGLSANLIRDIHRTIKTALARAVRYDLLRDNPCTRVDLPAETIPEITTWTPDQMRRFLAAEGDAPFWGSYWWTLAETWLRIGEQTDLRWSDLDPDTPAIIVSHAMVVHEDNVPRSGPVKTARANRTIPISRSLAERLRAHREHQQMITPLAWRPEGLIWPGQKSGTWMYNATVAGALRAACLRADVPILSPHELRHSGGSIAYRSGRPINEVSERLGHTDPAFTLRTYLHTTEDQHRDLGEWVAALLSS